MYIRIHFVNAFQFEMQKRTKTKTHIQFITKWSFYLTVPSNGRNISLFKNWEHIPNTFYSYDFI